MNAHIFKFTNNGLYPIRYALTKKRNSKSNKNLNRGFRSAGISDATMRKIKLSARTLAFMAEPRNIRNSKGLIVIHKISFITLTLPAEQFHTDQELTAGMLGMFFDRARKMGLLSNYVWRAEKQENGNIHYHILTDTYAPFSLFRRVWYLCLIKFGYLQKYQEKFVNQSFEEYSKLDFNKKRNPADVARAYARGVRNGWSEPPSVQVDYESDSKNLEGYLAKYFSKSAEEKGLFVAGRSWGCSSSVSSAAQEFKNDQEFNSFWFRFSSEVLKRKKYVTDFFEVVLCSLNSIIAWSKNCHLDVKTRMFDHYKPCVYYLNYGSLF